MSPLVLHQRGETPLPSKRVATERLASLVRRRPVKVPTRVLLPVTYAMWLVLMAVGMSAIWLDIVDPVKL